MSYPTFPINTFGLYAQSTLVLSSDVGYRLTTKSRHYGVDIIFPVGTIIRSPYYGIAKVKKQRDKKGKGYGWGLYIELLYSNLTIRFAHLSKAEIGQEGTSIQVSPGTVLGLTGGVKGDDNSGSSTGPHLHLEISKNNSFIDPKPFLARWTLKYGNTILHVGGQDNPDNVVVKDNQIDYIASSVSNKTQKLTPEQLQHTDIEKAEKKLQNSNTTAAGRLAPGIWQIIKLLIDSSVQQKQVVDSSISIQTGSLMNFVNKICQKPMVEFFGDTYGSQYYFFVRKPPFDKEGFWRMINDGFMINVDYGDVISSNLDWNTQGIYSWYQYRPYADFLGSEITTLYFPSLFFPQFAQIWGSKPLVINSNYFNYIKSGRFNYSSEKSNEQNISLQKDNMERIIRGAVRDFKYLIESNAYNAFTRRGTITLKGNRSFKRGTAMYFAPTNEVFYIDSVTQDFNISNNSVSRNTVLEVSHGMVFDYIKGYTVKTSITQTEKKISYFNIIDFGDFDKDIEKLTIDNFSDTLSKWKVNLDSFNHFMTKIQIVNQ